jgi:hypothetical protein
MSDKIYLVGKKGSQKSKKKRLKDALRKRITPRVLS